MTEESFSLRHNPLGIHSLDGTDIVIGKSPRRVPVKVNPAEAEVHANASFDQTEDPVASLGISSPLDLGGDLGGDLGNELTSLLQRKNTITARPVSKEAPKPSLTYTPSTRKSPEMAQRLREMREIDAKDEEDDFLRARALPEDVRKIVDFSPSSQWLTDDEDEDEGEDEDVVEEPVEMNPFRRANKLEKPAELAPSPPEPVRVQEPVEPVEAVEAETAPAPKQMQMPSIEELDPVSPEDRGRLFLQINKLSNLRGLPIDVSRKPKFTLSLDNGLQTVTTEPAPIPGVGMNGSVTARIGQEFELTVAKDLELVLTINVQMEQISPPPRPVAPPRFVKHEQKKSTDTTASTSTSPKKKKNLKQLLLRSPKKKQDSEAKAEQQQRQQQLQQQQQQQQQQQLEEEEVDARGAEEQHRRDMQEYRRRADMWQGITGPLGEYCRGYLFETHYEKDIYGVAKSYAIPLYNEWDTKAGSIPKPVCDLHVTMMYVPRLFGSEKLPSSLEECEKVLAQARAQRPRQIEGFLTQQGLDCGNLWRRRYFVLRGNELVSHHEATRKRRAIIHLESVVSVSCELSDQLWCIYEDRSFQLTFKDGESAGFYADTTEARDAWVRALKEAVASSGGQRRSWTDLIVHGA